ncbi:copper amine oxidase N-terminal domain-containing protein [Pseudobacteroides cellulosolvens]|uniref:Copper amine oxidase-like domain-containing protein n=1 Tax=Pseudobacteroides cellulosolvens ATCC 35603 = DSM 2933 TaxID=398512 RepID=A0A0L6JTZ6_9FIRM|nr:copper amine oxidase N-terminal domain-containing protein [Pseudobacteroides cellulosolvens]KNY29150.1 copper amine oxidase-like domain-containing protein [Pseudobacteroides cellulosolvens ATCC 35603 = DSM 2933]
MKKNILLLVCSIFFASLFASASFAADSIKESPKIKIIIDGKVNKYSKAPINYKGRTMLPFREVSVNLGVKNDNDHIAWNGNDRSIALKKDDVNVSLKIGSNKATVNSVEQTLDVEPVLYNGNTYIPARFVSQAFGKKVVWDQASNSVMIREEEEFNKVKSILEKSNEATKDAKTMKCSYTADMNMTIVGQKSNVKMSGDMEMDVKNFIMHMTSTVNMLGMSLPTEQYMADNKVYTKDPMSGSWIYQEMDMEQFQKQLSQQASIELSDKMYAGLTVDDSSKDEIILKGNIYMDSLMSQLGDNVKGTGIEYNSVYMEMSLDKTTYVPKSAKMDMSITMNQTIEGSTQKIDADMKMEMKYTDFNGDYEIKVPDEVISTAKKAEL